MKRNESLPARSLRSKQWTAFGVFCERLRAALHEEDPDTTAGCAVVELDLSSWVTRLEQSRTHSRPVAFDVRPGSAGKEHQGDVAVPQW